MKPKKLLHPITLVLTGIVLGVIAAKTESSITGGILAAILTAVLAYNITRKNELMSLLPILLMSSGILLGAYVNLWFLKPNNYDVRKEFNDRLEVRLTLQEISDSIKCENNPECDIKTFKPSTRLKTQAEYTQIINEVLEDYNQDRKKRSNPNDLILPSR